MARDADSEARTIGQVVGRNLAQLREARKQTQQEASAFLRKEGLAWTAANVASIESGRRETIDLGALTLLAYAYKVPMSRLFEGDGEMRLSAEATTTLKYYRRWLDREAPGMILAFSGHAARKTIDAMPDDGKFLFQADAELAARLGLTPKDVYEAAERLWQGRTLHEERDRRLAELGEMTPTQRRTRRGHITRQLAKELEPHLPPSAQSRSMG
ncbi:helix-turn-helix domain-containing protein [Streptosporangium canum]|uniref:helix-turn-helix domain-containing protein n=1 Tax=Streptosporangium canum TaxID=324952 RepID=UPI0033A96DFC